MWLESGLVMPLMMGMKIQLDEEDIQQVIGDLRTDF